MMIERNQQVFAGRGRRVHLIDEIRGICIVLMVAYHTAYDLVYLFGVNIPAFHWPILGLAQPFVAGVFIFISGVACRFSRSNLRRGLIALGCGILVSVVTLSFPGDQGILFGILHFLGCAMMLYALLAKPLDRVPIWAGILACGILTVFTAGVPRGYVGVGGLWRLPLPGALYETGLLFPLGFGGAGADYFPLLPWIFVFLAGGFAGRLFVSGRMPEAVYRSHWPPIAFVGRHTIWVYLLHQPVVYGILWLLFRIIRGA